MVPFDSKSYTIRLSFIQLAFTDDYIFFYFIPPKIKKRKNYLKLKIGSNADLFTKSFKN